MKRILPFATFILSCLLIAMMSSSRAEEPKASSILSVTVTELERHQPIPCRITVVDPKRNFVPLSVREGTKAAARAGVVYSSDGKAQIEVNPGTYIVYAGRGFEYGIDRETVTVVAEETAEITLSIRREVSTEGMIACDTHVHTFTHSLHGDATVEERAVTLAGEGIELPVLTDHDFLTNDIPLAAAKMGVSGYFTPVVGDEVTTAVGHFNAFAFLPHQKPPGNHSKDWGEIIGVIRSIPGERAIILNHPLDKHGTFTPFAPANFNALTGEHVRSFEGIDAVEVINSGAMQSDSMKPVHAWMALQNRGVKLTAVGAGDSHDVAKHIVGQGRTYIHGDDKDVAHLDVDSAVKNFKAGRASVSLGLLAKIRVDGKYTSGDLDSLDGDRIKIDVEVFGPSWTGVDQVELSANGVPIIVEKFATIAKPGLKYRLTTSIDRPMHDISLVAVASGPGVTEAYWPIEKPYQPTADQYVPRVLSITNPVYIDGDHDQKWTSPYNYAIKIVDRAKGDPEQMVKELSAYDEATAIQAADRYHASGKDLNAGQLIDALKAPGLELVRAGFEKCRNSLMDVQGPLP